MRISAIGRCILFLAALAAMQFIVAKPAAAQSGNVNWIGPNGLQGSGNWNTPTNWNPTGVPTASKVVNIVSSGTIFTVNYDYTGPDVKLFDLEIYNVPSQQGISQPAIFNMAGNTLQANNEDIGFDFVSDAGGQATFNQSGGTNIPDQLFLGLNANSSGAYTLSGNAILTTFNEAIGGAGVGSFTQTGGLHTVNNSLNVGNGTLSISGGAMTLNGDATVGTGNFNNAGTLNVSGTGSLYIGGTLSAANTLGTAVNLSGGDLSVGDLNFNGNPSLFHWTGGTLNKLGNVIWDPSAGPTFTGAAFGSSLTLGVNQTLHINNDETLALIGPFSLTLNAGSTHLVEGSLTVNPGGTLTQNPGSTLVATNSVIQLGGVINGTLMNQGGFAYAGGTFNARLISQGTFAMSSLVFTAGNGVENDAVMEIELGQTIVANGLGFDNLGTLRLVGATLSGSGSMVNDYGGTMQAHGTVNPAFTNFGRLTVDGTLRLNGGATNRGILQGDGTVIGNVTNDTGGLIQPSNVPASGGSGGSDPLAFTAFQGNLAGGTIQIGPGLQLNIANGWNNFGLVTLGGSAAGNSAMLGGRPVFNSGTIDGAGLVTAAVVNTAGVVRATGGQLTMAGGPISGIGGAIDQTVNSNDAGGRIEAGSGATVFYSQGLAASAGTIALTGGAFDNNNHPLNNTGIINGHGEVRTGGLTIAAGAAALSVGGGDMNVLGNLTNSGTVNVQSGRSVYFYGNVNGNGAYTGPGTDVYLAAFSPSGSPALPSFAGNVNLTSTSTLNLNLAGPAVNQVDKVTVDDQLMLAGTLHVSLTGSYTPARLDKFDILDFGAVSGMFKALQLPALASPLGWNVSNLYSTGTLSVVNLGLLPGDMNLDGAITAADVPLMELALVNKANYESLTGATPADLAIVGDADESGSFDNGDLQGLLFELINGTNFVAGSAPPLESQPLAVGSPSTVPEPSALVLITLGVGIAMLRRRRGRKN
ncbi:MAG TPA: PEP-CTERM sorting domain-containing protein [Pirellulales bacterium]